MIISVKEARDKILAEVLEVYIKCVFLEKYYSNLVYYIFSPYGEYTVQYYYNKIINFIPQNYIEKFTVSVPEGEFEKIVKRSIEEMLSLVSETFKKQENHKTKFINSLKILDCPIDASARFAIERAAFEDIKDLNYFFYLERYLRIQENEHNLTNDNLKNVVNVKYFTNYTGMQQDFSKYKDIRYGLRFMYKQNNTDNGDTNGINLKEKCFNINYLNRNFICTIPLISKETENISKETLSKFKEDIQIDRDEVSEQKYVKILKDDIINSDEYNNLFLKIFPINMIDLMLASKFYMSSKLFQKVLTENNVYKGSSNIVLRLLDSLVDYKEIQV